MSFDFYSPAPRPGDEDLRQDAVTALLQRGPADQPALNRIVAEVAHALHCPIALVTIVDIDRQLMLSSIGTDITETSRAISFSAHAILRPSEVFCVSDASRDHRFAGNPLVLRTPGIRFYMAAPLCDADGHALGAISAIGTEPRAIDPDQVRVLRGLAAAAQAAL